MLICFMSCALLPWRLHTQPKESVRILMFFFFEDRDIPIDLRPMGNAKEKNAQKYLKRFASRERLCMVLKGAVKVSFEDGIVSNLV